MAGRYPRQHSPPRLAESTASPTSAGRHSKQEDFGPTSLRGKARTALQKAVRRAMDLWFKERSPSEIQEYLQTKKPMISTSSSSPSATGSSAPGPSFTALSGVEEKAENLACGLERACHLVCERKQAEEDYPALVREVCANLADPKNTDYRQRVLSGEQSEVEAVSCGSHGMASEELQRERAELYKDSVLARGQKPRGLRPNERLSEGEYTCPSCQSQLAIVSTMVTATIGHSAFRCESRNHLCLL